jgi:hypothetical protein
MGNCLVEHYACLLLSQSSFEASEPCFELHRSRPNGHFFAHHPQADVRAASFLQPFLAEMVFTELGRGIMAAPGHPRGPREPTIINVMMQFYLAKLPKSSDIQPAQHSTAHLSMPSESFSCDWFQVLGEIDA